LRKERVARRGSLHTDLGLRSTCRSRSRLGGPKMTRRAALPQRPTILTAATASSYVGESPYVPAAREAVANLLQMHRRVRRDNEEWAARSGGGTITARCPT
jgi:hypothetical protein